MPGVKAAGAAVPVLLLLVVVLLLNTASCSSAVRQEFVVKHEPGAAAAVEAQLAGQGFDVLRRYTEFNTLVVTVGSRAAAASTTNGLVNGDQNNDSNVNAALQSIPGVVLDGVVRGGMRALFPEPVVTVRPANPSNDTDSAGGACAASDASMGPDINTAREGEGVPYGIRMVQADHPDMITISRKHRSKVLFCVIDTGLDASNKDFPPGTTGCTPGFPGGDTSKAYRYCYAWDHDANRHGTHTSGTIGAQRDGHGVVGVSAEGAQLYHYNFFGPEMQASDDLEVAAWQECISELDRRRVVTGTPDMKLVISMSYGSTAETGFSKDAVSSLAAKRNDVLWIAAAGNGGDNTTNYPAGYDQVISVGAVDWDGQPADFSTFNADVELAGPGVRTLSTIPLALTNESTYHALPYAHGLLAVSPLPPGAAGLGQDFFESPRPARVDGTPSGRVSAPLVDCGLALEPCAGASAGAVCLVQRGNNTFCDKLLNAAAGGCAGVVMFNREDVPSCERLDGVTTSLCPTTPASGWTPAITLSRGQGAELRAALAAEGNGISATLSIADVPLQSEYGLDLLSGTSMATPTVAGVAGLVWSAHTDCTAAEIRAALAATASRPGQLSAAGGGVLTRDEHYGYGIVRAHDAHEYLNAHPCAGRRVELSLSARALGSVRGGGNNGNSNELQGLAVGTTVHVRVSARESVTGAPIAGQRVALSALPPGGDPSSVRPPVMECAMAALTTNAEGIAATTCTMMAPGRVSLNVLALGARNATAEVALSARVRS